MIYAACLILCAAGSLFTSNSADSANVFAESNITLSNGVLPMISIIQYPYTNGGKPNYTISQFSLNSKGGGGQSSLGLALWAGARRANVARICIAEKLAENGFDWSLPNAKQIRAANLQPAGSCKHSCSEKLAENARAFLVANRKAATASELFYFIANIQGNWDSEGVCFITVFSKTTLVRTHSETSRILRILRRTRENVALSFKHFPLFRVGACFAMSQSMARNFAAEHLD